MKTDKTKCITSPRIKPTSRLPVPRFDKCSESSATSPVITNPYIYLLAEDSGYILLEDGNNIILEQLTP